jgi:hypothetical protein
MLRRFFSFVGGYLFDRNSFCHLTRLRLKQTFSLCRLLYWFMLHSVGQRRFQSSTTSTTFLHAHKKETLKKNWLSDPGAYPLLVVMGVAGVLVVGVIGCGLVYNPDVQIHPNKRGNILRDWSIH